MPIAHFKLNSRHWGLKILIFISIWRFENIWNISHQRMHMKNKEISSLQLFSSLAIISKHQFIKYTKTERSNLYNKRTISRYYLTRLEVESLCLKWDIPFESFKQVLHICIDVIEGIGIGRTEVKSRKKKRRQTPIFRLSACRSEEAQVLLIS